MEKVILFQGDSITDCGRSREVDFAMGNGYATFVGGALAAAEPYAYRFYNRGISGNRVVDLYARIKIDMINLKPDYMSILIGVNDVWHDKKDWENGVCAPKFKKIYRMLLEEVHEALPQIKIMLMEPFVLKGSATEDSFDWFAKEVGLRAEITKELASEFNLPFIPLQQELNQLAELTPESYWLIDGVHPTPFFHQYLSNKWLECFETIR